MTSTNCLNCNKELTDRFCSGCGQKADTHRITFRNFFYHDLLHGAFHLEKGMLFTAREALLHPGRAALDYISGKRKRYYNVFLLVLITIGVMIFMRHLDQLFITYEPSVVQEKVFPNEGSRKLDQFFSQKVFIFLFVPMAALNGFLLFRRQKLNLSEHFIISGMILLGLLLLGTLANFLFVVNMMIGIDEMFLSCLVAAFMFYYVAYGYVDAFAIHYSPFAFLWRIMVFFAMICLEAAIAILILFGYFTDWEFGQMHLRPFG